ncbi:regulatory protein GemA [Cypionkella psychrotolerans]|uniref:regulatory protein GemA n=1 Tax=Cypionkella psychrotolerans TaxID=1678131 RepID=UPI0006B4BC79|nr:regulatory protein GemA [Cypionkella psychrotolerans]
MPANTVLKTIHVAVRDLGMDNDTRRDLQLLVTGKDSLTAMTPAEHLAVLEALKARGFKPSAGKASRTHRRPATRGDIRFCHVLWGKLVRAGAVDLPGAAGLNAFIRARFEKSWGAVPFDIDGLRDWKQIATVIEALKAMCARAGIDL